MACCRCNRTGRCRNCSCVKNGRQCLGCLPQRLGNCINTVQTQPPLSAPATSQDCLPHSNSSPGSTSATDFSSTSAPLINGPENPHSPPPTPVASSSHSSPLTCVTETPLSQIPNNPVPPLELPPSLSLNLTSTGDRTALLSSSILSILSIVK